jgi:hypothetical protein
VVGSVFFMETGTAKLHWIFMTILLVNESDWDCWVKEEKRTREHIRDNFGRIL